MCPIMAKGSHCAVVVRTTPFPEKIRKTIHQHLGTGLLAVFKHQFLSRLLTLSILRSTKTAGQGCLYRTGNHHRTVIMMFLQGIEQSRGKTKVTLHKLFLFLRTVHPSQVEHEITILTIPIQLLGSRIYIIRIYGIHH